jgi:hypothetical protein
MTARGAGVGIALLLAMHNVLRVVATLVGAPFGLFNYLAPMGLRTSSMTAGAAILWPLALAALCLPAWAGWYYSRKPPIDPSQAPLWASALWSALTASAGGLLMALFATTVERTYGWALFVLLPILMGLQAAILLGRHHRTTISQSLGVAAFAVVVLGVLIFGVAVEGFVCLMMAFPLALPLAALGGVIGHALQRTRAAQHPVTFLLIAGLAPYSATLEHALQPPADLFMVVTSIELQASPERVWQTILRPASLAAPSQLLFRAGVAYPRASHIEGVGPSATRYCDFSTGKLVEPVLIWDDLRQLRFTVASNPLPMQEWTPYARIHPPHLDGFLVSRQGEFRLTPLPDGGTRLDATTWYQHHLWPGHYWRWWSDYIIHQVHGMVLQNIRQRAGS